MIAMFSDYDFTKMLITLVVIGAAIGGAIVATALLVLPWLWALAKPAIRALVA